MKFIKKIINTYKFKKIITITLTIIIISVFALIFLWPIYWMIAGSFEPQFTNVKIPPDLFPRKPTLQNYITIFTSTLNPARWLLNSIIVSVSTMLLTLFFSSLTGYSFAKKKFPGNNVLFFLILISFMLPKQVMLIPLFLLMKNIFPCVLLCGI